MTITIQAELHDNDATQRLQELLGRIGNLRPFFQQVGQSLADSARANFRAQGAPDGTPWVALRPSTVAARIRDHKTPIQILRRDGHLVGSIKFEVGNDEVRIGSPSPYAAIHQLGGDIQRQAGSRWTDGRRFSKRDRAPVGRERAITAHTITIPARPYLGVSAEDEQEIFSLARAHLSS